MNKIIVSNEIKFQMDDKIKYNYETGFINKLKITILENVNLEIIIKNIETKLEINIEILNNKKLNLKEINKNSKIKVLTKINVGDKSQFNLIKINDGKSVNSRNIINLNKKSKTNVILKTITNDNSKYDFIINHNGSESSSFIKTSGVCFNSSLHFNITSYIVKNSFNCISSLNNRIINFSDKDCVIRPNILVDEKASIKNNSFIGLYTDTEINKYKSLDEESKKKQIIKDFINEDINKTLANILSKYWR